MKFWDSSAAIPLGAAEPETPTVRLLREEDPEIAVWWGTRVECAAMVARAVREGRLGHEAAVLMRRRLQSVLEGVDEIAPTEDVRARAERLLAVHPLRAADALQLAAALVGARERPSGVGFVSLDRRLREAARREGFEVLP